MPRLDYRQAQLDAEIDRLAGPAREYSDSFANVSELIELAASDVFGQLVCYPPIQSVSALADLDVDLHTGIISFQWPSETFLNLGELLAIDDGLIQGVAQITSTSVHFDQALGMSQMATARILRDSSLPFAHCIQNP